MTKYCCVPGCKGTGGFHFPKDPVLRKKWQIAVRRETAKKKLWKPTDHSVVCYDHFQESDFQKSQLERLRKDLVPGAIPTVFNFRKDESENEQLQKLERAERKALRNLKKSSPEENLATTSYNSAQLGTEESQIFLLVEVSCKKIYNFVLSTILFNLN